MKAIYSFETLETNYIVTENLIPEQQNPQILTLIYSISE